MDMFFLGCIGTVLYLRKSPKADIPMFTAYMWGSSCLLYLWDTTDWLVFMLPS